MTRFLRIGFSLAFLALPISAFPKSLPAPQPIAFRVGSLRFDRPDSWRWVPPSDSLRAAQLEKKTPNGTLLITFSRFPNASSGSVQANLDRWTSQFSKLTLPAKTHATTGSVCPVTNLRLQGTLKGGLPGGPAKEIVDATLLGAIFQTEGELVVVKCTGPSSSIGPIEKEFASLVAIAGGFPP